MHQTHIVWMSLCILFSVPFYWSSQVHCRFVRWSTLTATTALSDTLRSSTENGELNSNSNNNSISSSNSRQIINSINDYCMVRCYSKVTLVTMVSGFDLLLISLKKLETHLRYLYWTTTTVVPTFLLKLILWDRIIRYIVDSLISYHQWLNYHDLI